ncbi:hypothetical protein [Arthrobacter bambusae]|nr:hypothetical protein [Arthrobacter bambusae]MDQ0241439.1 hypothetical protein [Arthrobacter bambusae]
MGDGFTMTADDFLAAHASAVEDILELSMLTAGQPGAVTDISWDEHPNEH